MSLLEAQPLGPSPPTPPLEPSKEGSLDYPTTSMQINYRLFGISTKVLVPDLPLSHFLGHGASYAPYSTYIDEHLKWKRQLYPSQDEAIWRKSCLKELESMSLGWPGIAHKGFVLALAACQVYICDIDDEFEAMDLEIAQRAVKECVAILAGERWEPSSSETNGPIATCQVYSSALYQHLKNTLPVYAAAEALRELQLFILGQIPELRHRVNDKPFDSLEAYLNVRVLPMGFGPLVTTVEQYYLREHHAAGKSFQWSAEMIQFRAQIYKLLVLQNDLGGLEKDVTTSNKMNAVLVLAALQGCPVNSREDTLDRQDLLQQVVAEHDALMTKAIQSWVQIQRQLCAEAEKRASSMLITLSVTNLQWTLSTQRYVAEGTKDVIKQY